MNIVLRLPVLALLLSATFKKAVSDGHLVSTVPIKQTKLHVTSFVTTRFVETTVEAVYVNEAAETKTVPFFFTLTPAAYVSSFSIDIDGLPYHADILDKVIAKKAFKDSKSRKHSSGYASQSGNPLNFLVEIDVSSGSTITFLLGYEELLRRDDDEFTHRVNIAPGQVVDDLKVEVFIMEPQLLKSLNAFFTPTTADLQTSIGRTFYDNMPKGSVQFIPSADQQGTVDTEAGIDGTLVVKYDLVHRPLEGKVETNDGYFAHFISPEGLPPAPKKIVFVMDLSGSMYGDKMKQTKTSLKSMFAQLREGDSFNMVLFSTRARKWKEIAVPANRHTIAEAQDYVDRLYASGGTNINDALVKAATEFDDDTILFHAIIFMTDGVPSFGETRPDAIVESVTNAINGNAALFCIGFGADVDELLLQRLASNNRGEYRKVDDGESAASQMEGFFQDVASSLLFNVEVTYNEGAVPTDKLTQSEFVSIFQGKEAIIAGKINDAYEGPAIEGLLTASSALGPLELPIHKDITEMPPMAYVVEGQTEKIWAYITIKELLQRERLTTSRRRKTAIRNEALFLSLKYQLVTPLTALLFYKPPGDDSPYDLKGEYSDPEELFIYETGKARVFGDPHFVIDMPNSNLTICFDVHGERGTIVNLLTDPKLDILVNARMGSFIMNGNASKNATENTLFTRMGVKLGHHTVVIAPLQILVDSEMSYAWKRKKDITIGNYNIAIRGKGLVTITHGDDIVMNFQRNLWKDHLAHFDFFLFNGKGFSNKLHGIVGQFQRKSMTIVEESLQLKNGMVQALMNFGQKEVIVYQKDKFSNRGYTCWWAKPEVYLDGQTEQYIVPKLLDHMTHHFE